jgi:hypothetical protein
MPLHDDVAERAAVMGTYFRACQERDFPTLRSLPPRLAGIVLPPRPGTGMRRGRKLTAMMLRPAVATPAKHTLDCFRMGNE